MSNEPALAFRIPDPDHSAYLDGLLMHDLTVLNTELGRYVLRYLDSDAGRAAPMPISDECALADRLTSAADVLRARAFRRSQSEIIRCTDHDHPNQA